ncbi:MAG: hypothetical protein ACAH10_02570 [Methylophilaceae bacterium]
MTLSPQQRWALIGGALILTLGAMYMLDEEGEQLDGNQAEVLADNSHASAKRYGKPNVVQIESGISSILPDLSHKALAAQAAEKGNDLFKSHAWYVPPPPKPVVLEVEKPVPVAPPLPFLYMGKLENTPQGTLIFLSARNKVLTAIAGQQVDAAWRLDKEDSNTLLFTYMPLGLTKVLSKSAKAIVASNGHTSSTPDAYTNPGASSSDDIPNN